ncbi:MAG: hypothetical protein C0409_12895 [Novosphingobium sp.]|nr:hypothetical protein [Novosphingobium sp.]
MVQGTGAAAQSLDFGVEATTDEVRRGISWSDGEVSASADASVGFGGLDASVRMAALRQSDAHANADVVADLGLGKDWDVGGFTVRTEAIGHVFGGADTGINYVELGLGARYSIGPLQVGAGAFYAPSQGAIGGDNLYVRGNALFGIPAFPVSVAASVGYTTGNADDPVRAARLRPVGNYADWKLGLEYNQFPFTVGLDYIGTDNDTSRIVASRFADVRHAGDRVVGRVRLSF